jgi:hypothetical protein
MPESGAGRTALSFVTNISPEARLEADIRVGESVLARLVALAYAAEHPDLFSSPSSAIMALPPQGGTEH